MNESKYDVFISYCSDDRDWVQDQLLPALKRAGLWVTDDSDFAIGKPRLTNIGQAVDNSAHTMLVMTPAWMESEWAAFERLLAGTADPAGRDRKLIPLLLEPCDLPNYIEFLTYADLTDPTTQDEQIARVVKGLGFKAHFFICYKRCVEPDERLACYLRKTLSNHGHKVSIDQTLRTGDLWLDQIDEQIKASDYLVVLLSEASADSEMVKAEVHRAYQYRKLQGNPSILPVRVGYEGLLPYSIDAFLDPLHYIVWRSCADDERVAEDILTALQGRSRTPPSPQLPTEAKPLSLSNDGRPIVDQKKRHSPLPEFDPRFLEAPGGTVRLSSEFYIRRDADAHLEQQIAQPGTMTTIRAARQTGKSSLLVRGMHHASQQEAKVVHVDLQRIDRERLETPDRFLRCLAETVVRKLHLDLDEVERAWHDALGPQDKITYLMEDYVLPKSEGPIVLALDEVDRLLSTPFHSDFFALIRS